MIRFVRERSRKCDACDWVGLVYYITIGSRSFRACNSCWCTGERLRIKLIAEDLDSVETKE